MTLVSDESSSSNEISRSINEKKRLKSRSVSFAPTVDEYEIPSRTSPAYEYRRQDFLDALIDSYKIQTAVHLSNPIYEEKKYVPKTNRTRFNGQAREHRLRHLMNKLEELSLWDREEELKASQAQFLREQKLERIADRQRNHDLCLHLMRQRHESEMESAVLLDRQNTKYDDEWRKSSIAQARRLQQSISLSSIPSAIQREKKDTTINQWKSPIGRFRQFQNQMNDKVDQLNEKFPLIRHRRYASIPTNVVPLFSETYLSLMNLPEKVRSNVHASSPDFETRRRAHSSRDVRVPLKEDIDDDDDQQRKSTKTYLSDHRESPLEQIFVNQPEFHHHQIKSKPFGTTTYRNGIFA